MRRFFLVSLMFVVLGVQNVIAQSEGVSNHSQLFKILPQIDSKTPDWAKLLYRDPMDFNGIVAAKDEYYLRNPFEKNIDTQNYKYWFKKVHNYVNDNGRIELPNESQLFIDHQRKQAASQGLRMNTWTCIGPNNTYSNSGNNTTLATQANVYCLGVAPSNPNIVYAGMETGGVFKTNNKGLNWFPVSYTSTMGTPSDIKVDPTNENIVFVTVNTNMFYSNDGGTTWNIRYTFGSNIEQLIIHPTTPSIMYAAIQNGLYKSTNNGTTWTQKYVGQVYDLAFKPNDQNTLYISINNTVAKRPEILKSVDSGDTWVLKANGYYSPTNIGIATVYGCKIGVTPANPQRVYAGIIATGKNGDNGWIGIYHSNDGAETWINQSGVNGATIGPDGNGLYTYPGGSDMNTNWFVGGYGDGYHQGWYNYDLDVSHTNADKLWQGTIWLCESANKGANIEYIRGTRNLVSHADIQDIDVVGNDIWIASDGGINYSNDQCQTTSVRMNGITASDFWGFGHGWNEDTWIGGRYHNGNAGFHEGFGVGNTMFLGGAERATGYVHPLKNKDMYTSDAGADRISTSLDKGSREIPNLGMFPTESYYEFEYSEVEWHPTNTGKVYVGLDSTLYVSSNGGRTFSSIFKFPRIPGVSSSPKIRRFEISRDDPNYIYAIVRYSSSQWRIFKSINGGVTFIQLSNPPVGSESWNNLCLTLNPLDKNEIWIASNSTSTNSTNKLYRSTNAGSTWVNRYNAVLSGLGIKDMIYHNSPSGDKVYVMTNSSLLYNDVAANIWTNYNSGLPALHTGFKMLPFYRDGKIRLASAKGIWEAPFASSTVPQAMPMALVDSVFCNRDTIQLDSRSIALGSGTTYLWSISPAPSYINNASIRNPKIVLSTPGSYQVTLQVTQADGQSSSKTIPNMLNVVAKCDVDPIPGKTLKTTVNGDFAVVNDFNKTNITHFTIAGWWKPIGNQQSFSALVSSGDWCAHCTDTEGLIVDHGNSKLWYKWPGAGNPWSSNSGLTIPINEWSYVALTIEPTKATLYLNDQKYIHNRVLYPGDIPSLHIGWGHYDKSFKGEIDEVTIWNRTLTEDEIRLMRHLTKTGQVQNDPSLIAYYQFNELANQKLIDNTGSDHAILKGGAQLIASNVPVAAGESHIMNITSAGNYNFNNTGLDLVFGAGTYPNGKVVISRLDYFPNIAQSSTLGSQSYWIMNNYGTNAAFTGLTEMKFKKTGLKTPSTLGSDLRLYKRTENSHLANWSFVDVGDSQNMGYDVIFSTGLSMNGDGQFSLDNTRARGWIGIEDHAWDNKNNWGGSTLPISSDEVIIPANVPFYPKVNTDAIIRYLMIQNFAKLDVLAPYNFTIRP